jgi:hypothetical protein
MNKAQLLKQITASLSESLGVLDKAARASHADATHESGKAGSKYDKDYDGLGLFPKPPKLKVGAPVTRTLIVYNDAFSDEAVELHWQAVLGGKSIAGENRTLNIPLGEHATVEMTFTPPSAGELRLDLVSVKHGTEQFLDSRPFIVE